MSDDPNHDRANTYNALANTPAERGYWQGYLTGARRRLSGGVRFGDLEAEAFEQMRRSKDEVERALGIGYEDGLAGKLVGGEG